MAEDTGIFRSFTDLVGCLRISIPSETQGVLQKYVQPCLEGNAFIVFRDVFA